MITGKPMLVRSGPGKEIWEYVRDKLQIPHAATKAVVTFDMNDVIRVDVSFMPVAKEENGT